MPSKNTKRKNAEKAKKGSKKNTKKNASEQNSNVMKPTKPVVRVNFVPLGSTYEKGFLVSTPIYNRGRSDIDLSLDEKEQFKRDAYERERYAVLDAEWDAFVNSKLRLNSEVYEDDE